MKFLTTDLIHKHLRLDGYPIEDDLLELYADSAEEFIFEITRRTYNDYIETYGEVPKQLVHAALLLVDNSYQQRSPVSAQALSVVPYGIDRMLKPYMKLSD